MILSSFNQHLLHRHSMDDLLIYLVAKKTMQYSNKHKNIVYAQIQGKIIYLCVCGLRPHKKKIHILCQIFSPHNYDLVHSKKKKKVVFFFFFDLRILIV